MVQLIRRFVRPPCASVQCRVTARIPRRWVERATRVAYRTFSRSRELSSRKSFEHVGPPFDIYARPKYKTIGIQVVSPKLSRRRWERGKKTKEKKKEKKEEEEEETRNTWSVEQGTAERSVPQFQSRNSVRLGPRTVQRSGLRRLRHAVTWRDKYLHAR